MKREIYRADHLVDLAITNNLGERYSDLDAPTEVVATINDAVMRGQCSGLCYSGGLRYSWDIDEPPGPTDVRVEFTRNGEVDDVIAIPLEGWLAFQLVASRRNVDPASWLTIILGIAVEEGMTLRSAIRWLFPRKSDVATRFEDASSRLNEVIV